MPAHSGSTQPPNPALQGFTEGCEGKPQPCWYGIVPGVTTLKDVSDKLKQLGYEYENDPKYPEGYKQSYQNDSLPCSEINLFSSAQAPLIIDTIQPDDCRNVFLGNFIDIFNNPDEFYLTGWSFYDSKVLVSLKYKSGERSERCLSFMPDGLVSDFSISYHDNLIRGSTPQIIDRWHGFLPYRQYVKKHDFLSCAMLDHLPT